MAVTGTRVLGGRYALLEVLGSGGMATVWRARDEVLGREVAVKVLSPQHAADAAFRARFEREARHVASLSHPRLVTVFDSGVDEATPFIVMELVAGRTLRQILDEAGALPADDAIAIAVGVCEALEAAHAAGLVHRDIKPANIALSGGQVKVLDFGIARLEGPGGGTRTQAVLGTAAYLSPEQASGQPVGPQADLYALGCVLFEMLTGTPPFTADSEVGVAYRQVHDDPGPPSARRPGLPGQVDWVTTRLLAKNPATGHPERRPPRRACSRPSRPAGRRCCPVSQVRPRPGRLMTPRLTGHVTGRGGRRSPSSCSARRWRPAWPPSRQCCLVVPGALRRVPGRRPGRPQPATGPARGITPVGRTTPAADPASVPAGSRRPPLPPGPSSATWKRVWPPGR